jgi:hypothetical protein
MTYDVGMMFFLMLAGHAYADFALQTPHHSSAKYPGNRTGVPWQVGMMCHGLIHGGIVALITGIWWLGALETVAHAGIDYAKSRRAFGPVADQLLHFGCKVIWLIVAIS